jgi:hypothetical protein
MTMHVNVGWFKFMTASMFVQSNNKRKNCYIKQSGIHFHTRISLSAAKISQWSGLLLYWLKIHLSNLVCW